MGVSRMFGPRRLEQSWYRRLANLNWFIILCVVLIAATGVAMLYSVAGGEFRPWAYAHLMRFIPAFILMLILAITDIRIWMALSYPAYIICIALLIAVEVIGTKGMGGQRWLDLGLLRIQPSELMKIAVVMAIARHFHGCDFYKSQRLKTLIFPIILIALPMVIVMRQPDLGTSLMIFAGGISLIFLAGARLWLFIIGFIGALISIPIGWNYLREYQQSRVLTFLDPERDPLGAGYQSMQSMIALGNGGLTGKGFLQGTQSHLNFLPEMKTDFIFTVLVEEFGLLGGIGLILLYTIVLLYGLLVGLGCRNQFGRLLAAGLSITLFLYVFINIGMVMGLLPVVGVPLPMVSYGGSAMLTMLIAVGLILSAATNRQLTLSPTGSGLG